MTRARSRHLRYSLALAVGVAGCDSAGAGADSSSVDSTARTDPAALFALGQRVYYASQYDSARLVLEKALGAAAGAGDSVAYSRALTWLGLTAWRQGRYADARRLGESALALKERRAMREELFTSYNALGMLAHVEGRLSDAVSLFGRALDAASAVGDSVSIGKALGNRGLADMDMGEFARAKAGFAALRDAARKAGDQRAEANALTNLAMADVRLGDPYAAIQSLAQARALYRQVGYPTGEENALGQLGTAYDRLGDPHRAIAYLDSALSVARRHGLKQPESEDLQLLADLFAELGDPTRALEYLAQARSASEALGQRGELGDIARSEARAYAMLGRDDLARARAREAAALHRESGSPMEELMDELTLAELAQRAGDAAGAERALESASALARRLDVAVARAQLGLGGARVADARRDSPAALRWLRGAAADLTRLGPGATWEAFAIEARAYARVGRLHDAANAGRAAVAAIEQVRGRIAAAPLRVSFIAERTGVYADLLITLLRLGQTEEAFRVADAARGRALLEQIAAARGGPRSGTAAQLAEAERLLRRIDWLVSRLQEADTTRQRDRGARESDELSGLARSLATARREYELVFHRAISADPARAALIGTTSPDVATTQRVLRADEALVQFFVAPERLVTFVVTRDTVRTVEQPIEAADLAMRARLAQDVASRRAEAGVAAAPALRALYDLLVAPVRATGLTGDARALVVVPHGPLVHVPFAALVDSGGRYLVEQYALLTLPSAGALVALRERRGSAVKNGAVLAPFPDRLPASRAEAIAVSRVLATPPPLLGPAADEQALRGALDGAAVVHVASHGVLNESSPMFSRVDLAAPRRRDPWNDGRLEVHEILGLGVRSHLIFLSGCETAAGVAWSNSFRRGQDYATLAQAFLYAGATDVIATLWRIEDRGAAVFAERFYDALRSSAPVDALAAAQRAMIRDRRYAAPRYWAAYTLSGAGSSDHLQSSPGSSVQSRGSPSPPSATVSP